MKTSIFFVFIFLSATLSFAQKPAKSATVSIATSANCGDCKARIETALNATKGVKSADLNLETHAVTVTYKPKKIDEAGLRQKISSIGYDADDVKANQEAHDNLPQCCRKGGHD
jgi:mercuric ion binding protein